jgi:hypothetical protein
MWLSINARLPTMECEGHINEIASYFPARYLVTWLLILLVHMNSQYGMGLAIPLICFERDSIKSRENLNFTFSSQSSYRGNVCLIKSLQKEEPILVSISCSPFGFCQQRDKRNKYGPTIERLNQVCMTASEAATS